MEKMFTFACLHKLVTLDKQNYLRDVWPQPKLRTLIKINFFTRRTTDIYSILVSLILMSRDSNNNIIYQLFVSQGLSYQIRLFSGIFFTLIRFLSIFSTVPLRDANAGLHCIKFLLFILITKESIILSNKPDRKT